MQQVTEAYKTNNVQGVQMFSTFSKGPCCFMKFAHDYFIQKNLLLHLILRRQRPFEYYLPTYAYYLPSGLSYLGFLLHGATVHRGPGSPRYQSFTIIFSNTTLSRTPLDQWETRRRYLYLTTHNTHKTETSMPPAGFEHAIPAREWPQTHAWDRTATGIGSI